MPETFGERLRRLIKQQGLTQEQLADALDISRNTVWRWINDKATPESYILQNLATVLHVSIDSLLNDNPPDHSGGWELHLKILDHNPLEVMSLIAPVTIQSFIGTTDTGGFIVLGGNYATWEDDAGFKKIVAQLKKLRDAVIQQGKNQRH